MTIIPTLLMLDDVKAKINLIVNANKHKLPIMSLWALPNKLDPQKIVITDIYKTHTCPLARIMRKTLKQQGIKKLKVLYLQRNLLLIIL